MAIDNITNIKEWSAVPQNVIADFGDEGDFSRQHLLNPILLNLLGNVKGKHILDAGCGNGYLSRKLAKKGAVVTGIEPADSLFQHAVASEKNNPLDIKYIQVDLSNYAGTTSLYDVAVSNMVFMDIPDYEKAMSNCIKLLKPGGKLIFSISHPCFEGSGAEWKEKGFLKTTDYFKEHSTKQTFGYSFHRPLSKYTKLLTQNNCLIEEIYEPQLSEEVAQEYPEYERDHHIPSFIIISSIKMQTKD